MIYTFKVIRYFLQMYLKAFTASVVTHVSLIRKTEIELELLIGIDMLLMVERGLRVGVCYVIH